MKTIYKAAVIAAALSISAAVYAVFFAGSDNAKAAELANLKGEMLAIEQAFIQKKGGISFHCA
ncbi:hypothetical protein [Microvirga sp. G4-2]|uniref:hypothetical protein n=1 Tax=Microvirga sp. G4-2 TaxID=3434467 RepID=UPI004043EB7E